MKRKRKNKNNLVQNQQPKIDNVNNNNNNRELLVGPLFSGKIYMMLKNLSRTPDRDIYILIESPVEQNSNSKIKIKEIGEEIKPLKEYETAIKNF